MSGGENSSSKRWQKTDNLPVQAQPKTEAPGKFHFRRLFRIRTALAQQLWQSGICGNKALSSCGIAVFWALVLSWHHQRTIGEYHELVTTPVM